MQRDVEEAAWVQAPVDQTAEPWKELSAVGRGDPFLVPDITSKIG